MISLPKELDISTLGKLYSGIVSTDRKPNREKVTVDFSNLCFIRPTGVTALSNLLEWLKLNQADYEFTGIDQDSAPIRYLDDSQFFHRYMRSLSSSSNIRTTTKPLEVLNKAQGFGWLGNDLSNWLTANTGKPKSSFRPLLSGAQEIFHNIHDHSGIDIGSVFAQHFPQEKRLYLSISDIGVGIPENIRRFSQEYRNISDYDAIGKACEYGFTTSSRPGNAGRGLADLLDFVTLDYNSYITIVSDYGYFECSGNRQKTRKFNRQWLYPGCLIDIEINLDRVPVETTEEEFEW